jgi:hypothetical protein
MMNVEEKRKEMNQGFLSPPPTLAKHMSTMTYVPWLKSAFLTDGGSEPFQDEKKN